MIRITKIFGITAFSLLLFGCGGNQAAETEREALPEGQIEVTAEQFGIGKMKTGNASAQTFTKEVACRGFLTSPANATAKVSTPISGSVQSVLFKLGDAVRRGQTLCTISGNDFLTLQQQFAEASALYQKAKADYERMKALQDENIGAKKDLITAESLYKTASAGYNALKARIKALNVSPDRIEAGEMYTAFPVVSPIAGHITGAGVVVGEYIDPSAEIAGVVDVDRLQLRLSVFDADIPALKEGQAVRFALSSNPEDEMTATLMTIGRAVNPETKSIDCIAKINPEDAHRLVSDSYVEAYISVDKKEALALPSAAVQKEGNDYFVYTVVSQNSDGYILARTPVEVGSISREYTEILGGLSEDIQVITSGIETL